MHRFAVTVIALLALTVTPFARGDALDVMSFNLRYGTANDGANHWRHRADLVKDVIRTAAPDVVGIQEGLRFQLDELRDALPAYEEFGVGRADGVARGEYAAILFRRERLERLDGGTFWFSDDPGTPGSTSWGNSIPRICTWARFRERANGTTFFVYNVHFDHASAPSRAKSAELLAARIAVRTPASDPVIVTGDFNAGESSPPITFLRGERARAIDADGAEATAVPRVTLRDTLRAVHPTITDDGTFGGFTGQRDGPRIDWIFVLGAFTVTDAAIVHTERDGRYPSDHYPVTARLERAATDAPAPEGSGTTSDADD